MNKLLTKLLDYYRRIIFRCLIVLRGPQILLGQFGVHSVTLLECDEVVSRYRLRFTSKAPTNPVLTEVVLPTLSKCGLLGNPLLTPNLLWCQGETVWVNKYSR